MLPTPEQVKEYIAKGINCSHLEVEGDGQHFFATIVSDEFDGLRLAQRHQKVYARMLRTSGDTSASLSLVTHERKAAS